MKIKLDTQHFQFSFEVDPAALALGAGLPTSASVVIDPSNPANPFDEIGRVHNQAIDHLYTVTGSLEGVVGEALDGHLGAALSALAIESPTLQEQLVGLEEVVAQLNGSGALVDAPFGYSPVIPAVLDWYVQLEAAGVSLLPLEGAYAKLTASGEAAPFIDVVREFEAGVLDLELDEAVRLPLLAASSVARHSAAYWDLGGGGGVDAAAAKGGGGVVFADAFGALKGAVTGGGWVGAIFGGVKSSVVKAAKNSIKRRLLPPKDPA